MVLLVPSAGQHYQGFMPYDTLGRRSREKPLSSGRRVRLTDRDLLWFQMLERHGPLPIGYLHAFAAAKSEKASVQRATLLFHEAKTPHGGHYLTRPAQQFQTLDARCQPLVYDLTDCARDALCEAGLSHPQSWATSSHHWRHDFMIACVTASIDLATSGTDWRFIYPDEISKETSFEVGYRIGKREIPLQPDRLFGLHHRGGKLRLYALEVDRGTEVLRGKRGRKTIERCLEQYRSFIGHGLYREALGTTAPMLVMHLTLSEKRMKHMLSVLASLSVEGRNNYMLFGWLPQLGGHLRPPDLLTEVLAKWWHRAGYPEFDPLSV